MFRKTETTEIKSLTLKGNGYLVPIGFWFLVPSYPNTIFTLKVCEILQFPSNKFSLTSSKLVCIIWNQKSLKTILKSQF